MYTMIISFLCLTSFFIISTNLKLYKTKAFLFWLCSSCFVGWVEFILFLRYDAWIFDSLHVIGIKIFNVQIEDFLFCPSFSVIFYLLYYKTKKWSIRVCNSTDKLIFTLFILGIALIYYDVGSQFSKYMTIRTLLGCTGLIYCWNYSSFRHCILFLLIVYIIGFGWDLPSVNLGIWTYPIESKIYDGLFIKIINAVFPIELFGYYFTGGFFSFWTIAFFDKYFFERYTYAKSRIQDRQYSQSE